MKKILSFIAVSVLLGSMAWAQTAVNGVVTDESGDPLEGVAVLVKGTTIGAFTDGSGEYTLQVPEGATTLLFSMVGRETTEKQITGSVVSVSLNSSDLLLDEVVVTALGITREKKSLGYATQEVGGDEVTKVKDVNFINSLSGKVAGVDIRRSSQLGGSANVIVRGYKSLTGNNQVLFVVDGIIIGNSITNTRDQRTGRGGYDYGNAAMDINPEDIESISVLKGAAATALYGSRAANGVIQITTKKGNRRKGLGITVSTGLTLGSIDKSTLPRYQKEYGPGYSAVNGFYASDYVDTDPDGFDYYDFGSGEALAQVVYEDASYGPKFDPNLQVYDWRSYYRDWDFYGQTFPHVAAENDPTSFYETSQLWNTNVAIDGGTDKSNFRLSYTNLNQTGVVPNSEIKRNTLNFAGGYEVNERLKVSSTLTYTLTEGQGRYGTGYDARNFNQSFRQWYQVNVDMEDQRAAYEATGKNISWNPYGPLNPAIATQPHYFDNYYWTAYENFSTDERSRIFGNAVVEYKITDWLNFYGRVTTDRYSEIQEERIAVGSVDVPEYERYNRSFYENNFDLFLNFDKNLGDKLNLNGLVGSNIRRTGISTIRARTNGGLVVPKVYSLSNSASPIEAPSETETVVGVNGYFARATVGYANMLYLDLTGRYDVSSTLPDDNNAYFYPSASLSFVFSELLNTRGNFNFGKIRLNYAEVGNDAPALSLFDTYVLNTPFNGVPLASVPSTQNNPNLLPENTRNVEAGVELSFFQNRLSMDLAVYRSNTFNQILPVSVTGATGSLFRYVNAGNIQNQGLEVILRGTPIKSQDFRWDIAINWAANRNEVIELFEGQTNLQLASVQGGVTVNATVGEPYGAIWGSNYVFHTDGNPIVYPHWQSGIRFRRTATPEVIGGIVPDWKGGLNNTLSYKSVSLSFLIDVQQGGNFFSLDSWYGYATGLYDFTAGTNAAGGEVRAFPENGGGLTMSEIAEIMPHVAGLQPVVQTGNDPQTGLPISEGTVSEESFYMADVYTSLGYLYAPNAFHVYDASFVKLREVNLNFSLPKAIVDKTALAGLDVSFVGRNLWILLKNSPYSDPEAGLSAGNIQGNQSGAYPAVKEYGFNIRARF